MLRWSGADAPEASVAGSGVASRDAQAQVARITAKMPSLRKLEDEADATIDERENRLMVPTP
jgi:hypothetical protein